MPVLRQLDDLGGQLEFYLRAFAWTPRTLRRYKREIVRLLAEVSFGSGALAVAGGTVGVICFLTFFTGTEVGLQGYQALNQIGSSAFTAVIPLYVIGLLSSFLATRTIATVYFGQSAGTYDYYFHLFLPPADVLWSFGKAVVFSVLVVLIHCYYGYTASGGPAGVGVAVGRAVRLAIVSVNIVDFFLSLAVWGATTTVRIAG